jgi:thioredoxin-related protein
VSALQDQYAGRLDIIMVNVDSPEAGPYLARYRVRGTPSFILFDRHGRVAQSVVGWPGTAAMARAFDQVVAQP